MALGFGYSCSLVYCEVARVETRIALEVDKVSMSSVFLTF